MTKNLLPRANVEAGHESIFSTEGGTEKIASQRVRGMSTLRKEKVNTNLGTGSEREGEYFMVR